MSQNLRSVLQDLIPDVILSQKRHAYMSVNHNCYRAMSIYGKLNKVEMEEAHCVYIENSC
jgi:hypothetical protein